MSWDSELILAQMSGIIASNVNNEEDEENMLDLIEIINAYKKWVTSDRYDIGFESVVVLEETVNMSESRIDIDAVD